MRELTIQEVHQVSGGIAPAIYGAIVLGGRIAASPVGSWIGSGLVSYAVAQGMDMLS